MVDPLSYFSFQPVLHDWCNKCSGMCYPVYGMMHIKEPLLLIRKNVVFVLNLNEGQDLNLKKGLTCTFRASCNSTR